MDKQKIKVWLKDKYNFAFVILIIAAILFRGYYFTVTNDQPLWWDEAGYMAGAKAYAGIGSYTLESIRSSGFSRTMSLFYILGITDESIIRFFGLYVVSIILIILTYILLSQMYPDKRIALLGTAIMVVLWENLFYSNRFHTENFALIFEYIAVIALFKIYSANTKQSSKKWWIQAVAISSIISIWYRPGNIFFIPAMIFFALIMGVYWFTKTKARGSATLAIFIWAIILLFILLSSFSNNPLISSYYHPSDPISWNTLNVFIGFFKSPVQWMPSIFFYAFLIGIASALLSLYIYFPNLIKEPGKLPLRIKSDIFNFILLATVMIGFIAFIRPKDFEYRWFFPLLPALLSYTAGGVVSFSDWVAVKANKKSLSVFLILIIAVLGIYTQIAIVDPLIKVKVQSYSQIKDAGLWFKQNTNPNEVVLSTSTPQMAYYSERETISYGGMSIEEFENFLAERNVRYLMVSIFEGNPPWLQEWLDTNTNSTKIVPVEGYQMNGQTVAIIYTVR